MLELFNINYVKDGKYTQIYVNNQTYVIKIYTKYSPHGGRYICYLNNYELCTTNEHGYKRKALRSFLVDPSQFIRRNVKEIEDCGNINVKFLLFELERRANNMKYEHIKWILIMQIKLVDDIMKIIRKLYVDLTKNARLVKKYLRRI